MTTRTLTDTEHKLLAALWRHVIVYGTHSEEWLCRECWAHAAVKHEIRHAPGCALFGLDPALLAQLDEFDKVGE